MKILIKLYDLNYRFDVYQIFNIFYDYNEFEFVTHDANIEIKIDNNCMEINNGINISINEFNNELKVKEQIKKYLYLYLYNLTGKSLPWGTLIGIRPTKLAISLINLNFSEDQIIDYYNKHYLTSEEKAKLCFDVAKTEIKYINLDKKAINIYLGMPFCPTRCLYCSFASNPIIANKELVEPYLNALAFEIKKLKNYIEDKNLYIENVYFGGGTPTSVSNDQFYFIMNNIYNSFIKDKNIKEFTVECGRPDSITKEKLLTMKEFKVNRISINPQTMNDETLRFIGRIHKVSDIIEKYRLARNLGFDNINMDVIIGLPGEDISHVKRTCEEIYKLNPDSLTIHGLSIKRGSRLHENIINNKSYKIADNEELNKMYDEVKVLADKLEMTPYYLYRQKNMPSCMENIGYGKTGKFGVYNIQMIEERQTIIALGADAVSKVVFNDENRFERFANLKDVKEYTNRIEEIVEKKIILLNTRYIKGEN